MFFLKVGGRCGRVSGTKGAVDRKSLWTAALHYSTLYMEAGTNEQTTRRHVQDDCNLNPHALRTSDITQITTAQIFQKPISHFKTIGARMQTLSNFLTENPQKGHRTKFSV
jgi:hypothetical protein